MRDDPWAFGLPGDERDAYDRLARGGLFDQIPLPLWRLNRNGGYLSVSPALAVKIAQAELREPSLAQIEALAAPCAIPEAKA